MGAPIPSGSLLDVTASLTRRPNPPKTQAGVYLSTGDAKERLALMMTAHHRPLLTVESPVLNLGDFGEGISRSLATTITVADGQPSRLTLASRPLRSSPGVPWPKALTAKLTPIEPDAKGRSDRWRLLAEVAADAAVGPQQIPFTVTSDRPIEGATETTFFSTGVLVAYRVHGPVSLSGDCAPFGLLAAGAKETRRVQITRHDPEVDLSKLRATVAWTRLPSAEWKPDLRVAFRPVPKSEDTLDVVFEWPAAPSGTDGVFHAIVELQGLKSEGLPIDLSVRVSAVVRTPADVKPNR